MNLDNKTIAKELMLELRKRGLNMESWGEIQKQIEEALDTIMVEGYTPPAPRFSKLHLAAFALETVAHMKGLEEMLLPHVEFIRKVDEALKAWRAAGTTVQINDARWCVEQRARENGQ